MKPIKSKRHQQALRDSDISGLVYISQNGGYQFVISDQFYLIDNSAKIPMRNVLELLQHIRKKHGN